MTLAVEPSRLWASRALHPFHLQHNTRRAACHEHTLSHQRTTAQWNVILHRNEHFTSNHMRRCWSRFIKPSVTRTYSVCSTGKPFASHVGGVEKLLVIILTESICLRRAPHLVLIRPLHFNSALNLHQTLDWPVVPSGLSWIISSWKLFWKTVKSVFFIFRLYGSAIFTPTLHLAVWKGTTSATSLVMTSHRPAAEAHTPS